MDADADADNDNGGNDDGDVLYYIMLHYVTLCYMNVKTDPQKGQTIEG